MVHSLPVSCRTSTESTKSESTNPLGSNPSDTRNFEKNPGIGSLGADRPNPFDTELFMDERHYERNYGEGGTPEVSNTDIGMSDNHFTSSGQFGLSNIEELELAIETCKELIRGADEDHLKKRSLVKKLIELRIKLHELKEGPTEITEPSREVCGHRFQNQALEKSNRYCERCNGIIWAMFQIWFRCKVCGYRAHEKCLNSVTRFCAGAQVKENPTLLLKICPEKGLSAQKYRCAECKVRLSFSKEINGQEPRLCDYSGRFYCQNCHWNDEVVIPARVVHNWDFEPQKVSRSSKQYLKLVHRKPLIKLEALNPKLFNYIEELRAVRKMRADLLIMKCYFLCCKFAREEKILQHLKKRQHFVESAEFYSMKDLEDLHSGELETELRTVMDVFVQHIKHSCVSCQGNGFICELCSEKTVIFPFDDYIAVCRQCFAVFHRLCYEKRRKTCSRCTRRADRALSMSANTGDEADDESDTAIDRQRSAVIEKSADNNRQSSLSKIIPQDSPNLTDNGVVVGKRIDGVANQDRTTNRIPDKNYRKFNLGIHRSDQNRIETAGSAGNSVNDNNFQSMTGRSFSPGRIPQDRTDFETGPPVRDETAGNFPGRPDDEKQPLPEAVKAQKSETDYLNDQLRHYKMLSTAALANSAGGGNFSGATSESVDDFDLSRQITKAETGEPRGGHSSKSPQISPVNQQGLEEVVESTVDSTKDSGGKKPVLSATGSNPFEDDDLPEEAYDDALNPFTE